jgi:hypothetical protein
MVREVSQVCESVGRILDDEQRFAVDVLTGIQPNGRPASLEAAVITARQNLKTYILESIALTALLNPNSPVELIVWSSQQMDTTAETLRHFADLFESDDLPHLRRRLKGIWHGTHRAEIELINGPRIKFKARSGKGSRGLTGDIVILDEGFAVDPSHLGALLPVLSTKRRAQVYYGSSAGRPESEVLRGVRDRGRAGKPGAPAYVEWCAPGTYAEPGCGRDKCDHAPGTPGCVLDDPEMWRKANPALDRRITRDYVKAERLALVTRPAEFARERLGWWDEPLGIDVPPISPLDWDACADPDSAIVGGKVWAVDLTPDGRKATIGVAGMRADGKPHGELIDSRHGTEWIVPRLVELIAKHDTRRIAVGERDHPGVILDPAGPAGGLLQPLRAAGIDPVVMGARDVGQACAWLQSAVQSRSVAHLGQEQVSMALAGAISRTVGDGLWAWGRIKSDRAQVDISPLVVITGALWGLSVSEARPAQAFFAALR